jgi:autotransporter-associated beta strand protein
MNPNTCLPELGLHPIPSAKFPARRTTAKLAGAIALLSGLAAAAHAAVATWDAGAGTQEWNNPVNWSNDTFPSGFFPDGVATINTATGLFPIISVTPIFTPSDIEIGVGAAASGRLDQTGGTASTGSGNWMFIGREGGTGTFNITGGTFNAAEVHMAATGTTANSTVNVSGSGVINTAANLVVADGTNNTATAVGTLTVSAGGTVDIGGDLLVAFAGGSNTLGTLNIGAGGTVNVGSAGKRWLIMNMWDTNRGQINITGGTLTLLNDTDIRFSTGFWGPGASNGPSSITLSSGSIVGSGLAVLDLNNNADRAVSNTFNLNGGSLTIGGIVSGKANGDRVINFNGGTLRAAGSAVAPFISATAASSANVLAGGAIIDSNGFDITIARGLVADAVSTGGGLTKQGSGTLTLSGINTYTGNTVISSGGLVVAESGSLRFVVGASGVTNKVVGSGNFTANGSFDIDVTSASAVSGHSWQLVDRAALNVAFGPAFAVTGFAVSNGAWVKPANGTFYEFDPATGILRVIADPGLEYPAPTVTRGASREVYVVGSDIALSVTAVGTGNLSYQWYYQATANDTPTVISGATLATLTIVNATTASGGIYSVVVSDDAPSASGQPPTTATAVFPAFTVVPGSNFTVAYYRFEEGVDGNPIVSASDSIGANVLTATGAPIYSANAKPYTVVPRTGANNNLGASFAATGSHGLSASTSGTLATTPFSDFTIETFVRLDSVAGWQTIVGRDDTGTPGIGAGAGALVYLSKSGANNGFRIEVITATGTNVQVNSTSIPATGIWYHVAAVGDSVKGTLTLYVNGASVGSSTGFTGLLLPDAGAPAAWTVGRGQYDGNPTDYLRGSVDEVRFTQAPLPPSQFLNATDSGPIILPVITQAPVHQTLRVGMSTSLSVTATGNDLTYQWHRNGQVLNGATNPTLELNNVTLASDGVYMVNVIDGASAALGVEVSTSASAVVRVLDVSTTARSLGLNFVGAAATGTWSNLPGIMAPDVAAGFVPAVNWNNTALGVASLSTPLNLLEKSGATPSYLAATWSAANTWALRVATGNPDTEKTPDMRLLHGYIESRATTGSNVTITNIPYASYDVYVYVIGGANNNVGSVSINRVGSPTYFYRLLLNDATIPATAPTAENPFSRPFVIGESTTREAALTAPPATFVRFTGVSGAELTVSAIDSLVNVNSGGIAAVQIVDTTPAGSPYPPTLTSAPASRLVGGGSSVTFSVTAVSNNGGTLSYKWQKDGVDLAGQTSPSLTLSNVTSAAIGTYSVVVTDVSGLGSVSATRSASLIVVDADRPLMINGDLNTGASPTFVGNGILRTTGESASNLGQGTTVWNGILGGAGAATRQLVSESTGLALSAVTFSYSGAGGVEDNITQGFINPPQTVQPAATLGLIRDYLYTDNQSVPLTASISGLHGLVGKRATLVVYAYGKLSTAFFEALTSDTATVTLAGANNYLGLPPKATTTSDFAGRNLDDNNPEMSFGESSAYVSFDVVIGPGGTVAWSLGPDADGGRIPLVGFQLLVTNEDIAPPAQKNLVATAAAGQVSLAWDASSGASSYTIQRSMTADGPYTVISAGVVTGTSYVDSNVINGTTYYYVVAAVNALAQSANSNEVAATPASLTSPLQDWRQIYFGSSANTGDAADTADPDGDGIPNLLEYALGTNPTSAGSSPVTLGTSDDFLTLSFTRIADSSLTYSIEASDDLGGSWTTVHTFPAFGSAGSSTYTDTVPVASSPRRFLRLKVTRAE